MSRKPMGRPKVKDPNVVVRSIRLSSTMIADIDQIALEDQITFSKVIRNAVDEYIKKRKYTDKSDVK